MLTSWSTSEKLFFVRIFRPCALQVAVGNTKIFKKVLQIFRAMERISEELRQIFGIGRCGDKLEDEDGALIVLDHIRDSP